MDNRKPPALATWMLDHLRSRGSNDALSGDLLEAFRIGRSAGWYWYQVIAAIAIVWGRNVWHHRVTLFLPLYGRSSPRLVAAPSALQLGQPRWRYLAYSLAMVVYLRNCIWCADCHALHLARSCCLFDFHLLAYRNLYLRSVRKGVLWGSAAYGLAQVCKLAISIHYPQPPSHAEHWGSLTVLGVIENFGTWNTLLRFPDFIGTATTLWFLESRDKPEEVRAA